MSNAKEKQFTATKRNTRDKRFAELYQIDTTDEQTKKQENTLVRHPLLVYHGIVILCQTWNWYDYAKMNIIRSFFFLCLLAALLLSVVLARLFCSLCPHVANFLCVSNLQPQQTQVFISETRLCFITGRFYELLLPLHRYYHSKHSSFTSL